MAKEQHLAHTKWLCRYHIVFTSKYGRKVIYGHYREEIGKIDDRPCADACPDAAKVCDIVDYGYITGKSSLMILINFPS